MLCACNFFWGGEGVVVTPNLPPIPKGFLAISTTYINTRRFLQDSPNLKSWLGIAGVDQVLPNWYL